MDGRETVPVKLGLAEGAFVAVSELRELRVICSDVPPKRTLLASGMFTTPVSEGLSIVAKSPSTVWREIPSKRTLLSWDKLTVPLKVGLTSGAFKTS